ncbi:MAG: HAD family phosphatase [Pseudomonadota bacterium]
MNIIFDLGGVVFDWAPERFATLAFDKAEQRAALINHVVHHPDWLALDAGSLSRDEAIRRGAQRSDLSTAELRQAFDRLPDVLQPIDATIALVRALHALGAHRLFVLSNMHHASADHLESAFDIWPLFEACVFSCRVGLIKPDPAIFRHLLDQHALDPQDSVFIDDAAENVAAARALGMQAIAFTNARQCGAALSALGIELSDQ